MAKRKVPASFKQKFSPDDKLAEIIGSGKVTRAESLQKFWRYVKANDLQDCNDGRIIVADECIKRVFGKGRIKMTEVLGGLIKHLEA